MGVKEKILKIMALCLEINPPEINEIGEKKNSGIFPLVTALQCVIYCNS